MKTNLSYVLFNYHPLLYFLLSFYKIIYFFSFLACFSLAFIKTMKYTDSEEMQINLFNVEFNEWSTDPSTDIVFRLLACFFFLSNSFLDSSYEVLYSYFLIR